MGKKAQEKELKRSVREQIHSISHQLDTNFRMYAIYVLEHRGIPSFYDALTNVQRYVLQNAPRSYKKTISLVGECISDGYHHGDGSLAGAINKVARPFGCAEPFLIGDGFFGTPVNPDASAPRYTSIKLNPTIANVIDKHSKLNKKNSDEQWEYLRTEVPIGLLSLIMGIAVGYKSSVLPRKLSEIEKFLDGKPADLRPHFTGFTGNIESYNGLKKTWLMEGVMEFDDTARTVRITEIPPLMKYDKFINKLANYSENSNAEFTIVNDSRDTIDITLRHRSGVPWDEFKERISRMAKILVSETLVFTKDSSVVEYDEIPDYLNEFRVHREWVRFSQSEYDFSVYSDELEFLKAKLEYLKFMLAKKRTEAQIDAWMEPYQAKTKERLNRILLRDLSDDSMKRVEKAIEEMTKQLAEEGALKTKLKLSWEELKKTVPVRKSSSKTRGSEFYEEENGIEVYNAEEETETAEDEPEDEL